MSEIKVDKETFYEIINNYPEPLERDVTGICEPPVLSYNDFSEDKIWPESIVGFVKLWTAMTGHPAYNGEQDEYYVEEKYIKK